ncbi:hypothetical protein MMC17_005730 [Xylographa soralifera]|nr:hypothetical protein [Xylographa soralifera]
MKYPVISRLFVTFREEVRLLSQQSKRKYNEVPKVPVTAAAELKTSTFIAIRSKPSTTSIAQSNGHTAPSSSSPEPHLKQKRISIDLTVSDSDDGHNASQRPPSKQRKISHTSRSTSEEEFRVPASTVQVVIPRKTPTAHAKYAERLAQIPGPPVTLFNNIDDSTPPTNFQFIDQYVFGPGTKRVDKEFRSGCTCYQDSRGAGCSSLSCECLEDTAIGENGKSDGFAYYGSGPKTGLLRYKYLKTRNAIYECNELCSCNDNCKSRVVQKGRQIPLEIFKTRNRGWGLRSPAPILKGQFIDTYLGEVLTDRAATQREALSAGKDSYLYSLDKFRGVDGEAGFVADEQLFVVDGQFMGGPTRFLNHSCAPNCRQFTVSNVRGDTRVYALAFFALEYIEPWTELTFDYVDREEGEEEEEGMERGEGGERERGGERGTTRCLCGASNCRTYLWL